MGRGVCKIAALLSVLALAWDGAAGVVRAAGDGNILSPRFDLGIWTLVVFVVLLLVLRRFAWGPMLEGLKRREQNIRQALEDAQRAREDAEKIRAQIQGQMDQVSEEIRKMWDEARKGAQRFHDEKVAEADAKNRSDRERLLREINTARDQAIQQLWGQTAQLAALISSKAVRRELNLDDHRRLVDEAIAELRDAGNSRQRQTASVRT